MDRILLALGGLALGGSAAVIALALAGRSTWSRYGARWRCWAWLLLCLRLAVPLPLLPQGETQAPIRVELPAAPAPSRPAPSPAPEGASPPNSPSEPPQTPAHPADPPSAPDPGDQGFYIFKKYLENRSPAEIAAGLWLAGALGMLAWNALSHLRFLAYLRRWSQPARERGVLDAFRRAGLRLQLRRGPRLLVCQGLRVPMLAGVLRPALLLPCREDWTGAELDCSLLHELTHYRRRDIWLKALAMWVNALHWFNPLMWYLVRVVERDTELACDEDVLRRLPTELRAAYGRTILSAAGRLTERDFM